MQTLGVMHEIRGLVVVAIVALAFQFALGQPSQCGEAELEPVHRTSDAQPPEEDLESLPAQDLLWVAREASRSRRYNDAVRHARAVTLRKGVGPEVFCPAWMILF
jgi:hypothetical protein